MDNRFTRLNGLDAKFGFQFDVKRLLGNKSMSGCSLEECCALASFYSFNFYGTELYNEICDCRMLVQTRKSDAPQITLELLNFVVSYGNDVFPNLRVALQFPLTISVSVASYERSYSKLKLILTYLRSSMSEIRLNNLALLRIEKQTLNRIDFNKIIDDFAASKARKICL